MFRSWPQEDQDAAVAWQNEQDLKCGSCGLPRDESMDRLRQFGYEATAVRCHSCAAIEREAKRFTSQPHDPAGLRFSVSQLDLEPSLNGHSHDD